MKLRLILPPVVLFAGVFLFHFLTSPILIESAESRTVDGKPVFNEIQWGWKNGKEVWSMRQSHNGRNFPGEKWDRLMIVMDGGASFLQLNEKGERVEYRASCFLCHSNGPRAIRPQEGTSAFTDQMKIALLNFRIKLYGRVKARTLPQIGPTPFRHEGKISNTPLTLSRCTGCHKEDGLFSRGTLTRQNSLTIAFMVKEKHMPPLGELTPEERMYLENFMNGF